MHTLRNPRRRLDVQSTSTTSSSTFAPPPPLPPPSANAQQQQHSIYHPGAASRSRQRRPRAVGSFFFRCFLILWVVAHVSVTFVAATGGELAVYPDMVETVVVDDNGSESTTTIITQPRARQDLCARAEAVRVGNLTLRNALRGLELRPLLRVGKYFRYDNVTGIGGGDTDSDDNGGFMAQLLDELGRRAGFTWRQSFGVTYGLPPSSSSLSSDDQQFNNNNTIITDDLTFTDLLEWSVEHYDVSVNWWDQTLERLERGISFLTPWFDGSLILIGQEAGEEEPVVDTDRVRYFNWLRPFTADVWWVTIFTIITSGLTYQWIEHLGQLRNNRSYWQWFLDNVYLSAINFPQNYEFQPSTTAGRIFGVSMSIWALVMTATYTANLASLLVDTKILAPPLRVEGIEDVLALGVPVCTYANTGMDAFLKQRYRNVKRVPLESELETYQALRQGRCALTVAYYQNWLGFERNRTYNPACDLEWVGRTVRTIQSGFAVSSVEAQYCSSLVRDVLDIYLQDLIDSGYLQELWDAEYDKTQDINCDEIRPEVLLQQEQQQQQEAQELAEDGASARRKLALRRQDKDSTLSTPTSPSSSSSTDELPKYKSRAERRLAKSQGSSSSSTTTTMRRELKGGNRGAAAGGALSQEGGGEESDERLTLNQMAGTFMMHYVLSIFAIVVGYLGRHFHERPHLIRWSIMSGVTRGLRRQKSKKQLLGDAVAASNQRHDPTSTRHDNESSSMSSPGETPRRQHDDAELSSFPEQQSSSTNAKETTQLLIVDDTLGEFSKSLAPIKATGGSRGKGYKNGGGIDDDDDNDGNHAVVTAQAWRATQRELQETKRELQQTRREMSQQMDLIVSMLTKMQVQQQQQESSSSSSAEPSKSNSKNGAANTTREGANSVWPMFQQF